MKAAHMAAILCKVNLSGDCGGVEGYSSSPARLLNKYGNSSPWEAPADFELLVEETLQNYFLKFTFSLKIKFNFCVNLLGFKSLDLTNIIYL